MHPALIHPVISLRRALSPKSCNTLGFFLRITPMLLLLPGSLMAHERWILTDSEILDWGSRPLPELWRSWSWINALMIGGFTLFTAGWIRLSFTGARELFPDLQARLSSYGHLVSPLIRFCLAWVLISSAFGLEPRNGVAPMASPTLFAPDLDLNQCFPPMLWLRWVEFFLGLGFLLGIYVRILSVVLLLLTLLATVVYQAAIYAYAGALIGVAIYLLYQGPGGFYIPLPVHPDLADIQSQLAECPRPRAQAIMRILTGINIFYLAVVYKIFQPNLAIAILTIHDISLFGMPPDISTLLMALVEFTSGILIILGALLRPLALFFLGAFFLFAAMLPESWMSHALFYSVMLSFLINGAGYFAMPEAKDKKSRIVILGGTVSGIHAAMKIERLIGQFSNVEVILVSEQPNVLFYPLLPEVIGGTMQPGNAVNPIRRVLQKTRVILGEIRSIDTRSRHIVLHALNDREQKIQYDELVLAQFLVPNLNRYPGLMAHACPINSVGDALHIRKEIMNRVELASLEPDPDECRKILTFAVIGTGQRACGTAEEISAMLATARSSYPVLQNLGWTVNLYEDTRIPYSDFEANIGSRVMNALESAGVRIVRDREVAAVTQDSIVFTNGDRSPASLIVNSCFMMPSIPCNGEVLEWPLNCDASLGLHDHEHVWAAFPPLMSSPGVRRYTTTSDWMDLGHHAGEMAWASSQGFPPRTFAFKSRFIMAFNMGRHSIATLFGLIVWGLPAWFLSRMSNLATMPGLERNLRILIDWTLDVPFRADIAVLAPESSPRLQLQHFEAGDEVIRQGQPGETAYVVRRGELEVIRNGKTVGHLGPGDLFGEVALLKGGKRTATVRCLSSVEVTVFAGEDFNALSVGSSSLAKAIRAQAKERAGSRKTSPA